MSKVTQPTSARTGKVRPALTRTAGTALALVGMLAAIGVGYHATTATLPAAAARAAEADGDHGSSPWAEASDAGTAPSLTNDVMEPEGGTGSQLPLGVGLVGLGLLGVGYGLTARAVQPQTSSQGSSSSKAAASASGQLGPRGFEGGHNAN